MLIQKWKLLDANGRIYESDVPGIVGGHRRNKIYGRMNCPSALRALAKRQYVKNRVFFLDEETAIAADYRPCGSCMKEQYLIWKNNK
jgi:methylphosphotriester-DNA--protein-cysteine methyltransferase